MRTAYVFDPLYLQHDMPHHPENRQRLERTLDHLSSSGILPRLLPWPARDASENEITLIHDPAYIAQLHAASERGNTWLDADTYVVKGSFAAAIRAAGGVITVTQGVLSGQVDNALALVRPPGHHAVKNRGMGFCLLNNVAIAAAVALQAGVQRIMIADIDLHHGNGTQEAFYEDPRVLYVSTHQSPLYPGTGHWREMGRGAGVGHTINVPLPAGVGDRGYARVMDEIVAPATRRFRPECILVSAGYDAHWLDPIGSMLLSVTGYAALVQRLLRLAEELCDGRIVLALEGGYDLCALAECVAASLAMLLGDEGVQDTLGQAPRGETPIDTVIEQVQRVHGLQAKGGSSTSSRSRP